jgi:Tfp pilus assembly protein PilN
MVNLWHAIRQTDRIAQLEQERDYLDARLAEFERLAEEFAQFKAPDHMCRMRFIQLLNMGRGGKDD